MKMTSTDTQKHDTVMKLPITATALALAMLLSMQNSAVAASRIENAVAVFAGLDKITGRIIRFDVKVDETVQFGALQVTPKVCYTRPATEAPETNGFVEVDEVTLDKKIRSLFRGWMFAASPGLHAVEHSVYDVWLTDCKSADKFSATPVTRQAGDYGALGFQDEADNDDTNEQGVTQEGSQEAPIPIPRPNWL